MTDPGSGMSAHWEMSLTPHNIPATYRNGPLVGTGRWFTTPVGIVYCDGRELLGIGYPDTTNMTQDESVLTSAVRSKWIGYLVDMYSAGHHPGLIFDLMAEHMPGAGPVQIGNLGTLFRW